MNKFINKNTLLLWLIFCFVPFAVFSAESEEEYEGYIDIMGDTGYGDVVGEKNKRDATAFEKEEENSPAPKRQRVLSSSEESSDSSSDSDESSSSSSSDSESISSSDDSDSCDSDSNYTQPKSKKNTLLDLIQNGLTNRKELRRTTGLKQRSLNTYINGFRRKNLLSKDANRKLSEDHKRWMSVAQKIKNKDSLAEIIEFCGFNVSPEEQKFRLNSIVNRCYEYGLLKPKDTLYLKSNTTVIGRNGSTKEKILAFLTERSKGNPTKSIKDLVEGFNRSYHRQDRDITHSTFQEHIKDMSKPGNRYNSQMSALLYFYESCKDPEQARRAKRKQ